MLKQYLIFIALLLASLNLLAQCPTPGSSTSGLEYSHGGLFIYGGRFLYLPNQAAIDKFKEDFPHCTTLQTGLYIGPNRDYGVISKNYPYGRRTTESDITNLRALANLRTIRGSLTIQHTKLKTLAGLNLSDTIISEDVRIYDNELLNDIDALSNIVEVKGSLRSPENPALENLSALSNLRKVGDVLFIGNDNLVDLRDLSNLQSVGSLIVNGNAKLKSLDGLEALTSIRGELRMIGNPQLESIVGISNLRMGSIEGMYIRENPQLTQCQLKNICEYLSNSPNSAYIAATPPELRLNWDHSNGNGCNSIEEILQACEDSPLGPCPVPAPPPLTTQAEIDAFVAQFPPNCKEVSIKGDLIIEPPKKTAVHDITDLSGLAKIYSISGKLEITRNTNLESLSGLDKLAQVDDHLIIHNNKALINLAGLGQLTSIGGELEVSHNVSLTDLEGLNRLSSVDSIIRIIQNEKLGSLDALQSLTQLNIKLNIRDNDALTNIDGLSSIVGDQDVRISITQNDALLNLNGLRGITALNKGLTICHNDALPNLSGLEQVKSITGPVEISDNDQLKSIEALAEAGINASLQITGNPELKTCNLKIDDLVCKAVSKHLVDISDNNKEEDAECNSRAAVCKDE